LPEDFKQLCESFEPGSFSAFLHVLRDEEAEPAWRWSLLHQWRQLRLSVERDEGVARLYDPYGFYGASGDSGLILWGYSEPEGRLYWLADASCAPETWPVIAMRLKGDPWQRFDMATSEFVYRAIADPELLDFSSQVQPPFYLPAWWPAIRSLEDWERVLRDRPEPRS